MGNISCLKHFAPICLSLFIIACGGGGSGGGGSTADPDPVQDPTPDQQTQSITGGGTKGPLANAVVTVYSFDATQSNFQGSAVSTGSTNDAAAITGLALPFPVIPPYIMEFTSDASTTDITTGLAPVITTLRTVITQSLLDSGEQIYATPLTTMATDIAIENAVDSDSSGSIEAAEFEAALTEAAAQVVSTLGFGLDSSVDIFDTPPLVDSTTDTTEEQANVAAYRAAVEAVTAIAYEIDQQTAGGDTDSVLSALSADLADGGIDGSAGTSEIINTNTLQVLEQEPSTLPIPNTAQTVGDIQTILASETTTTGSTTDTTDLTSGSINTETQPAETNPDIDGDGVLNANDAFPNDPLADTDTDGDGQPDVAYNDAGQGVRGTIDTTRSDADDDGDGWLDVASSIGELDYDDYPLDSTLYLNPASDRDDDGVLNGTDNCPMIANTDQTDTDDNGKGDACSNDNDGDGVLDTGLNADNCPLVANPGQGDVDSDSFGDACDTDIDADGVANDADAFPYDGSETIDTDKDGIGNNSDVDDDNDGVLDAAENGIAPVGSPNAGIACSLLRDCDGDGVLDGADFDPTDAVVTFNFAPIAVADTATADEDSGPFAIAVLSNDTDNDGNPTDAPELVSVADVDPTLGNFSINGNDTITYYPVENAFGTDTFTYVVTDGTLEATGTVTVTINPVNDAPEAANDSYSTNEDAALEISAVANGVLDNDTDIDSASLTAAIETQATNGSVTLNADGTFTYTPVEDYFGSDSFTYVANDGEFDSAPATVTITVNSVNDKPVAANDSYSTNEDTPLEILTIVDGVLDNDTDIDSASLTAAIATQATNGSVTLNADGTFTYTPNANYVGSDSFTYVANDGSLDSTPATVTITVNSVNDKPVAANDSYSTDEDIPLVISSVANGVLDNDTDIDSASLTAAIATQATNGSVTLNADGTFTYTPVEDYFGSDSFSYVANDGSLDSAPATVNITVNAVNDAPVAVADATNAGVGVATVVDVLANDSDVDGDTFTVTALGVVTPANGTTGTGSVTNNTNNVTFTGDAEGAYTFTYTITDNGSPAESATATVTMTVSANTPPVAVSDTATTDEDNAVTTVNVLLNDTDTENDTLTIVSGDPAANNGTVLNNNNGTFTYTPDADFNGSDSFEYSVTDGTSTVIGTVNITVNAINDKPIATDASATTTENAAITIDVSGNVSDVDTADATPDVLSFVAGDPTAANGTVVNNGGGSYTYTPNANFTGTDTFNYTVQDSGSPALTATATVTVTVNAYSGPVGADMSVLLDLTQGGGVGQLEGWGGGSIPEFEYWLDWKSADGLNFEFADYYYDYELATPAFVLEPGSIDGLFLTSTGWVNANSVAISGYNPDGSMNAELLDLSSNILAQFTVSATALDISGELMSSYIDTQYGTQWVDNLIDPNAVFAAGAQQVNDYNFSSVTPVYELFVDDWCQGDGTTRFDDLNGNCSGFFIDSLNSGAGGYAATLNDIQVASAWIDTDSFDVSSFTGLQIGYDGFSNSALYIELVDEVTTKTVNYYERNYNASEADFMSLVGTFTDTNAFETITEGVTTLIKVDHTVFPVNFDIPATQLFAVENGFVREVEIIFDALDSESGLLNGNAINQILANLDPPTPPSITDLVGTWVSYDTHWNFGDPEVLHFFTDGYYETSGTCFDNNSSMDVQGMEWGNFAYNTDGSFTATSVGNNRGSCSLADISNGFDSNISFSNDDEIQIYNSNDTSTKTYYRLKGGISPLVGSWVSSIDPTDPNGYRTTITFFDNGTYMTAADCSPAIGFEYGTYSWDEGVSNTISGNADIDTNGDCGLNESGSASALSGNWVFTVTGDQVDLQIPLQGGGFDTETFTRHTPAFVPVTPPIAYGSVLNSYPKTLSAVYFEEMIEEWVVMNFEFTDASNVTVYKPDSQTGNPGGTGVSSTYEINNGVLVWDGSYLALQSQETIGTNTAYRTCGSDIYDEIRDCSPGDFWQFVDNQAAAIAWKDSLNTPPVFSGSPVNASTIFASPTGLYEFGLDDYDGFFGNYFEAPYYFGLEVNGSAVTDKEFDLVDGVWVEDFEPDYAALTPNGWQGNFDYRMDTAVTPIGNTLTIQNLEQSNVVQQFTLSFEEMDVAGESYLRFVPDLIPWMTGGNFSAGAKIYQTTLNADTDYYYIPDNNEVLYRSLDRTNDLVSDHSAATNLNFIGDNTATIEIGSVQDGSSSLLAVFNSDGTLELRETDWWVMNYSAPITGSGTWEQVIINGETLIFYTVPQTYHDNYNIFSDGLDRPEFLTVFDGFLRHGEKEFTVGQSEQLYFFNETAYQDIKFSITP